MNNQYIVEGYKGIIDLDLTNVDKKLHKTLINQHYKDIEEYKLEQSKLKPEQRYENTIGKAYQKMEYENYMLNKRLIKVKDNQEELDRKNYEKYLLLFEEKS